MKRIPQYQMLPSLTSIIKTYDMIDNIVEKYCIIVGIPHDSNVNCFTNLIKCLRVKNPPEHFESFLHRTCGVYLGGNNYIHIGKCILHGNTLTLDPNQVVNDVTGGFQDKLFRLKQRIFKNDWLEIAIIYDLCMKN